MKTAYPVILSQGEAYMIVHVPDFGVSTQGIDVADAIVMARDAIGAVGIDMEDCGEELPKPSKLSDVKKEREDDVITLVDIDFKEYRRKSETRIVKKNCSLPSWMAAEAEKAGINFSALLQKAIKKELGISGHNK